MLELLKKLSCFRISVYRKVQPIKVHGSDSSAIVWTSDGILEHPTSLRQTAKPKPVKEFTSVIESDRELSSGISAKDAVFIPTKSLQIKMNDLISYLSNVNLVRQYEETMIFAKGDCVFISYSKKALLYPHASNSSVLFIAEQASTGIMYANDTFINQQRVFVALDELIIFLSMSDVNSINNPFSWRHCQLILLDLCLMYIKNVFDLIENFDIFAKPIMKVIIAYHNSHIHETSEGFNSCLYIL